jgi:2-polyprenyl-6-methoxyphenol hydroxylase-like FAD-dependent oxidoreductase
MIVHQTCWKCRVFGVSETFQKRWIHYDIIKIRTNRRQCCMQTKAIIIGGGIGGLTAAIALQRVGIDVTVLERAEELREVGSGLPLFINALRALQKLDLAEELESIGKSVSSGTISTWKGDILADLRTDELVKRLGTISSVVHRAELHTVLLKAFGAEKVQLGATCIGVTQDQTQVCARLVDGREVRGDVLIGADGLHSLTRAQLFSAKSRNTSGTHAGAALRTSISPGWRPGHGARVTNSA